MRRSMSIPRFRTRAISVSGRPADNHEIGRRCLRRHALVDLPVKFITRHRKVSAGQRSGPFPAGNRRRRGGRRNRAGPDQQLVHALEQEEQLSAAHGAPDPDRNASGTGSVPVARVTSASRCEDGAQARSCDAVGPSTTMWRADSRTLRAAPFERINDPITQRMSGELSPFAAIRSGCRRGRRGWPLPSGRPASTALASSLPPGTTPGFAPAAVNYNTRIFHAAIAIEAGEAGLAFALVIPFAEPG